MTQLTEKLNLNISNTNNAQKCKTRENKSQKSDTDKTTIITKKKTINKQIKGQRTIKDMLKFMQHKNIDNVQILSPKIEITKNENSAFYKINNTITENSHNSENNFNNNKFCENNDSSQRKRKLNIMASNIQLSNSKKTKVKNHSLQKSSNSNQFNHESYDSRGKEFELGTKLLEISLESSVSSTVDKVHSQKRKTPSLMDETSSVA